jgi:hypothetical protein
MIPLDHFNTTTCYYFPGSETLSAGPNLTTPLQQAHSTMIPNTMTIPTENMVASQTPIGTPLLPSQIPSLPLGYNALNASIPNPTQVPFKESGVFSPPEHNCVTGFIPTLPQPPLGGLIYLSSEEPALVAPLSLSHLITRFMLVDNFTLGPNTIPFQRSNPNWNTTPN